VGWCGKAWPTATRAVDRTLFGEQLARFELAALGAQTILVSPTVGLSERRAAGETVASDHLRAVISDGTLSDTFATAALLVRLQNDMVPVCCAWPRSSKRRRCGRLQLAGDDVLTALSASGEDLVFTRLHKDVANQESNVALWHARRANTPAEAWDALADSLAYFAVIYAQHRRDSTDAWRNSTSGWGIGARAR
jgi:hypothetical protein